MLSNFRTQLIKKEQLISNVFLFRFHLVEPPEINFKAGQYLLLKIKDQSRLYSICSPDFIKNYFELVVEMVPGGLGSTYLSNLKIGEVVNFQGPAGLFVLRETNKPKIFLATGTGIAPIRAMIISKILPAQAGKNQKSKRHIKNQKNNNTPNNQLLITNNYYLFWGLRTRNDVYFFEEFKKLSEENSNFQFKICLSRERELIGLDDHYFILGHINDGLLQQFNNLTIKQSKNNFDYYLCGDRKMIVSMTEFLQKQGVEKENIFFEKF